MNVNYKNINTWNKNMHKRVLITGANGSIGLHVLARIMRSTDWEVIAPVSFKHKGLADRLTKHFEIHPDDIDRVTVITHDLTAPFSDLTKKKIGKVDYIINLASCSDVFDSIQNPVPFVKNNVDLMLNMLEYAREVKPEVFIQFSTDEVYGASKKGQRFEEWSTILPSNPYAASKAAQEDLSIAWWRTYNVPVIITNTVNNFSELQSPAKFPVIAQNKIANDEVVTIHGSEDNIGARFYIHSGNVGMALIHILKNLPPYMHKEGEVDKPDRYNITSDDELDNLELSRKIAEFMGKELKFEFQDSATTRPGHDKFYGLSGEKLKKTGWVQPHSFDESMKNVVEWQSQNPDWLNIKI